MNIRDKQRVVISFRTRIRVFGSFTRSTKSASPDLDVNNPLVKIFMERASGGVGLSFNALLCFLNDEGGAVWQLKKKSLPQFKKS